ncbi:hypothetical protein [uncultured Sphingomonas sp.]|uniref:hypothetical protein n=1 Tax=uncultured Sphingomonas sp. TaxID=158754 RepID=UPI00258953F6|nr:hypothetical protein [uncultured Sphingomonas sp.]
MRIATICGLLLLSSCSGWGERCCKFLPSTAELKIQLFERRLESLFNKESIKEDVAEFIRRNPECCSFSKAEDSDEILTKLNNFWLDSYTYSVRFASRRDGKITIRNEFGSINACGEQIEKATFDSWVNAPLPQRPAMGSLPATGRIPQVMMVGKPVVLPLPRGELFPLATAIEMGKARP